MPVRINVDERLIASKIEAAWDKGLAMLSAQILRDCNEFCKEDTGTLIQSSAIHSQLDKGLLIWQTPYAARQYYEIPTAHKDVNSNASWRWCEVAKQRYKNDWARQAQAIKGLYK